MKKVDRILNVLIVIGCLAACYAMLGFSPVLGNDTTIEFTAPSEIVQDATIPETTEPIETELVEVIEQTIPEETIVVEETTPTIPEYKEEKVNGMSDLDMLACVIYCEHGGDASCDDCRRRVGDVVLNRVNDDRFPNTIYEVLTQRGQYGTFSYQGLKWPDRANNPGEKHAVERAYRIAEELLTGNHSSLYGNGYIWQAEFHQGHDEVYCCGTYFGK